jgi:uncharacterized protein (TIGR02217 family)
MATTFDEIELDPQYSAEAMGGPEFVTAVIRSGQGGGVAYRNANRQDYISKYEIEYKQLTPARRKGIREFAVLREGQARGFRLLAPDDNQLIEQHVGWLNPATQEIEYLPQTDGELNEFYLIQHYSDQCNNYTRRIIKPSPFDDVLISVYSAGEGEFLGGTNINAGEAVGAYNVISETVEFADFAPGAFSGSFNFHQGKIIFDSPAPDDCIIKVSCVYHVPVVFSEDWQKFSIDDGGTGEFKISLEELLPVELGIV